MGELRQRLGRLDSALQYEGIEDRQCGIVVALIPLAAGTAR